jgi:hypothetical protein
VIDSQDDRQTMPRHSGERTGAVAGDELETHSHSSQAVVASSRIQTTVAFQEGGAECHSKAAAVLVEDWARSC